jgi:hypothetical protein
MKWAVAGLKASESLQELSSQRRSEAVPRSGHEQQLRPIVISKYQGVERTSPNRISTDDEFLALIDAHLQPCSRALPWLISAVPTFRHQALQTLGLHGLNEIGKTSFQLGRMSNRISELIKNPLLQKLAPNIERLSHYIPASKN